MSERYHKAARDGYLALLKEATRKDLNTPDTDGMTPTLWAAYHGQIEALQLICSRGGEANMCDIWGNTPLHHAAINGHIHIVTFLINFGANIWALDNDFHSAMDAAAGKDQMECVRVLDTAATKQNITHPKQVARLKEKARKDTEKQIKECERLKKKHENRRNKKYTQEMEAGSSGGGSMHGETVASLTQQFSKMSASQKSGSVSSFLKGSLQKKHKKKEGKVTLEGQLGNDVIFVSQEGSNGLRTNVRDVFGDKNRAPERSEEAREFEDGDHFGGHESLFKRAGLGNMLFRRNFTLGMSIEEEMSTENEMEDAGSRLRNELLKSDWGLKAAENLEDVDEDLEEELPWNEEDIGLDDYEPGTTPLEAFLASQNMMEFIPFLAREQIDLESLMLCSDDDLRGIQLPLGPRKKLLSAVDKRKMIIKNPNKLIDTVL